MRQVCLASVSYCGSPTLQVQPLTSGLISGMPGILRYTAASALISLAAATVYNSLLAAPSRPRAARLFIGRGSWNPLESDDQVKTGENR